MTAWDWRTLAEVCEIKPQKAEVRRRLSGDDLVSFVPMEDLGIDQKSVVPIQKRALSDVIGSYTYFADGDVLLAKITPCFENGKLGIAVGLENGVGFGSSEYIVFRPVPLVDKQWLYYFLSRDSFRVEGEARMGGAVGHKRVAKEFIDNYLIPIPVIEEQHRIVAILDEAFAGIATAKANAEKNLQNAGALFHTVRRRIFDDIDVKQLRLGDITEVQSGGTPTVSKKQFWDGGIPWYSSGELNALTTVEPERTISINGLNCSNAKVFPSGSLLIGMYDTAALKMSVLDREAAFNQAIAGAKPSNILDTRYLLHAISAQKEELLSQRRGVRQKNLSLGKIKEIMLPLPSLEAQKRVVEELHDVAEEIAKLESLYTRKLAALEALKQSLLHQAFSGQL